jgi:hypothetical protein
VKTFLSIQVDKNQNSSNSIYQSSYIKKIIQEAELEEAKASKIPVDEGYYKLEHKESLLDNAFYRITNTNSERI